jgi:pimeloyl-ACP methyl ester carboxylesterase
LTLAGGRTLGIAEFGDPSGEPILYFHGHPGSRLEAALLHEPALRAGARLIGSDRPGMGLSRFQPGRRILDWPADVEHLADALGLERFAVAGGSGGGPYAAACAYSIPHRLTGCGLISCAGPPALTYTRGETWMNRTERRLALHAPPLLGLIFAALGRWVRSKGEKAGAAALGAVALGNFPEVDRLALAEPPGPERLGADLLEAFAGGSRGPAWEARLLYRPWGFDPGEIRASNIHLWHGRLDRNVTPQTGRAIAAAIPGTRAHYYPGDGHLSAALNHPDGIFEALLGGD